MKYSDKFKDPRWQKKRLEILERDMFICRSCFDPESTLNAHHLYYIAGRDPWDYPSASIVTLCDDCHKAEHESKESIIDILVEIVDHAHFIETIGSIVEASRIYSRCGIPPNIHKLTEGLVKYTELGCSIGELTKFLYTQIEEAVNGAG